MTAGTGAKTFFVKGPSGVTVPSFRTRVVVWLLPVLTIAAGLFWALSSFAWVLNAVETEGVVTEVYQYEVENAAEPGTVLYAPVFSYTWSDGSQTTGALGLSGPDFNFEIGSVHTILYDPSLKGNVRFPGFLFNYFGALIVLAIGAMFGLISLMLWIWVKALARKYDKKET